MSPTGPGADVAVPASLTVGRPGDECTVDPGNLIRPGCPQHCTALLPDRVLSENLGGALVTEAVSLSTFNLMVTFGRVFPMASGNGRASYVELGDDRCNCTIMYNENCEAELHLLSVEDGGETQRVSFSRNRR